MLLHTLAHGLDEGRHAWQRAVRARLGIAEGAQIPELRWMLFALHLVLWPAVIWALLHVWGLHERGHDLRLLLFTTGFSVAGVNVVPGKVLLGTFYFLVLFTFTRWIKSKMERDWLPRTSAEPATRETIASAFGYVTFVIAALIGLAAGGFDFTKLAIVAGALSVGIGFGLQNIVNNFVSGLIILFERPVRIGDYVRIGATEGFVRRIRIRSTEIRTWDRETIIVPNSDLLSNHLRNLNLKDRYSRVSVAVSVPRSVDAEKVRGILLQAAAEHPQVTQEDKVPGVSGPKVLLTNIGAAAMDFELRVAIRESNKRSAVASDLRFAIDAAIRAAQLLP